MPTDVILELEKIRDPYSGLGQFCKHLATEIGKASNLDIAAIVPKHTKIDGIRSIVEKRQLYKHPLFAPNAKLWHLTHQDPRYLPPRKAPYVLTIHDLNDLIEKPDQKPIIIKKLEHLISRSAHIVCISQYTKNEVIKNFEVNSPISVIKNGVPKLPAPKTPQTTPKRPFFFNVGTVLAKKNIHSIVSLAAEFEKYDFVIAGSNSSEYAKKLIETKTANVYFVGKISDEFKAWYLEQCCGFIFPSLLEGFGIPIVEAMSFGKPLFLSRESSVPETGGEDAFYFDNFQPQHMKKIITEGLSSFNQDRSEKLKDRAKQYSWATAANEYLKIYHSLI